MSNDRHDAMDDLDELFAGLDAMAAVPTPDAPATPPAAPAPNYDPVDFDVLGDPDDDAPALDLDNPADDPSAAADHEPNGADAGVEPIDFDQWSEADNSDAAAEPSDAAVEPIDFDELDTTEAAQHAALVVDGDQFPDADGSRPFPEPEDAQPFPEPSAPEPQTPSIHEPDAVPGGPELDQPADLVDFGPSEELVDFDTLADELETDQADASLDDLLGEVAAAEPEVEPTLIDANPFDLPEPPEVAPLELDLDESDLLDLLDEQTPEVRVVGVGERRVRISRDPALEADAAAEPERTPLLRAPAFLAPLRRVWNGPLGWESHPDSPFFIAAKAFARLGLLVVLPVVLAVGASFPLSRGSAFPVSAASFADSPLAWRRGLIEYPVPERLVEVEDRSLVPDRTLVTLRQLYDSLWPTAAEATRAGSPEALRAVLTQPAIDALWPSLEQLADAEQTYAVSGAAMDSAFLAFHSASPSGDPQLVRAGIGGSGDLVVLDAVGDVVSETRYYDLDLRFVLGHDGWRIDLVDFDFSNDLDEPVRPEQPGDENVIDLPPITDPEADDLPPGAIIHEDDGA